MSAAANAARAEMRRRVAHLWLQSENDVNFDWPDEKIAAQLDHIAEPHSGDCTKQPWTCMRCAAEDAYRFADGFLARLPHPLFAPARRWNDDLKMFVSSTEAPAGPVVHHLGAALQGIADEHADVLTPRQCGALYAAAGLLWTDDEASGGDLRTQAARIIWNRFAPSHAMEFPGAVGEWGSAADEIIALMSEQAP